MNSHRAKVAQVSCKHPLNMVIFTDLESRNRSRNVVIDDELDTRIAKASGALDILHRNVGDKEVSD